jgi:hypothetical protein
MNALELADLLETTESTNNRAAAMLRQQAAEIEKLMSLVDIQKAVSRDVDIDFLNETINQQAAEIEAGIELVRKLQEEREALKKENDFIKNNLCTPLLGPMFHGHTYEDGKALQTKPLTDEEIDLVREVLNGCVSSIKTEIDQELQTFKGYEHCSNLPSLESELKDAEKAMEILRKAKEK